MSGDRSYNGWTNYETWNVALWLDNDEGTYHQAREMASEAWEDEDRDKDAASRTLADRLREWVPEAFTDIRVCLAGSGPGSDLLGAALSSVDWGEIADHYLDEMIEEGALESKDEDDEEEEDERVAEDPGNVIGREVFGDDEP